MSQSSSHQNKITHFFSLVKQSLRGGEYDYTKGSIRAAIVLLSIPMILELSLESVFAVVDMFFVGKLGSNAMQTVGLTESAITIIYSVAIGLSTAATAMVARRVGEKKPEEASHAGAQAILISIAATLVISIAGVVYAPEILGLMGADANVVKEGISFTRIMIGSSAVILLLFLINGIFRGAGNAAIALRSLWIASIINIILDPIFIFGIGAWEGWGLKGAAIATVIGRGVGVIYQCYYLFKGNGLIKMTRSHFIPDWTIIRSLISIAWPATFQFIIASGSWIILTRLVAVTGGADASAGYQVAIRNLIFFILPAWGLSNAAATLVGQNLGANQPERAEKSVMLTAKYNAWFMSAVMLLFIFFAGPIIRIFTSEPAVISFGKQALQIVGAGYIFYGIGMVMIQAFNGAGDTRTPTIINLAGFWLFQIPLAYFLADVLKLGPEGAFIAIPVAETAIAVAAIILFRKGKWKKVKI